MGITINGSSAAGNIDLGTNGTITDLAVGGVPDNTIDNGAMADDAIGVAELSATGTASSSTYLRGDNTWATISTTDTLSNRNVLINGDMRISQRGTSESLSGSKTGYFRAPDRWRFYNHHSHGDWTVSQTSGDGPNAFGHTYKIACTTADTSIASNADVHLEQRVEANNIQPLGFGTSVGENLQLSFWVKSKLTGTYTVELYSYADLDAISNTYTVSSADTWEHKTVTFTAPGSGEAQVRGTGGGLMVIWYLAIGSDLSSGTFSNNTWSTGGQTQANRVHSSQVNLASSTNNYIQFTGMQLECAPAATAYEHRLFSRELADCQRYFQVWSGETPGNFAGRWNGTGDFVYGVPLATPLRASPSVECKANDTSGSSNGEWKVFRTDGASTSTNVPSVRTFKENSPIILMNLSGFSGGTDDRCGTIQGTLSASGFFRLSAEL